MQSLCEFEPLLPAEQKLMSVAATGERVTIGGGGVPNPSDTDVEIRAGVVRMLLLNLDPDLTVHAKGVRIRGAYITGSLDFQGADCGNDLTLARCLIDKPINFVNARMRGLFLSGSHCAGITADQALFAGSVFLRDGFQSSDEISLPSARITGDLQICDAHLHGVTRAAVFANSLRCEGSVFLGDYPYDDTASALHADSGLIFSNAVIGQDFYCRNAAITPSVKPTSNHGALDGAEGENPSALSLVRANVGGVLYLKHNQISGGIVNLSGAQARRLNDEPYSEGAAYRVRLDGFEFQDFAQHTDTTVKARLDWLARRPQGIEFRAQPYEHLARILSRIGHREDAHAVLMEKERQQHLATRRIAAQEPAAWLWVPLLLLKSAMLNVIVGYGYRPTRVLFWAALLIIGLGVFFQKTWDAGDMTPNSSPILVSDDWVSATLSHPENPAEFWTQKGQAGQDFETFNAYAYAADLLIPIVGLGQETAWAPSTSRSPLGQIGWWVRWVAKIVGWVVTALGAAAVTGVIRRD